MRVLFPFLEQVHGAVVRRHRPRLKRALPYEKKFNARTEMITAAEKLEFFDLHDILRPYIPASEDRDVSAGRVRLGKRERFGVNHRPPRTCGRSRERIMAMIATVAAETAPR